MMPHCLLTCCLFYVTLCIFFLKEVLFWGSMEIQMTSSKGFTWGKFKEGSIYRVVVRVQVKCSWRSNWMSWIASSLKGQMEKAIALEPERAQVPQRDGGEQLELAPRHWGTEAGRRLSKALNRASSGLLVVPPNWLLQIVSWRWRGSGYCSL